MTKQTGWPDAVDPQPSCCAHTQPMPSEVAPVVGCRCVSAPWSTLSPWPVLPVPRWRQPFPPCIPPAGRNWRFQTSGRWCDGANPCSHCWSSRSDCRLAKMELSISQTQTRWSERSRTGRRAYGPHVPWRRPPVSRTPQLSRQAGGKGVPTAEEGGPAVAPSGLCVLSSTPFSEVSLHCLHPEESAPPHVHSMKYPTRPAILRAQSLWSEW